MFGAGSDDVDPRGIDTAMTENVGELGNILLDAVEYTGEQVAKIMRKNLVRIDACILTEMLHFPPDVRATHRLTGFRYENLSRCDPAPFAI